MIWSLFALFAAVVLGGLLIIVWWAPDGFSADGFPAPCDEP
jgi:hypothetical protein